MRRVRLLLAKDLLVLRRSPALLAALVLYPLLFAGLVGLVVRFASDQPRVAFVDLDGLPDELSIAGESFDVENVIEQVNDRAELVPMDEEEAERQLETGEVVAAIVVPRGFASKLRGMVESPELQLRTGRGGLAGRFELQTEALVYRLNRLLSEAYISANLEYVQLLVEGGEASFLGEEFDVVGLEEADELLQSLRTRTTDPEALAEIDELANFVDEATLALEQTDETLRATANPIELETDRRAGRTWLLGAQLQAYALALTLAFVCVLLAAGAIAAERDENVVGRLVRGLVRLWELVAVKVLLGVVVALALGLALALVFGVAAEVGGVEGGGSWTRLPLLALGLALTGAAFGAFGVLLGVLARESRTAVLVAFLVTLPLVLVGVVPEGSVAAAGWISAVFPFGHAVDFFEAALFDLDPWRTLGVEALWLAGLGAAFAAAARLGVRRFLA
ncbi:MAG TPA: ABC transporter permease [Gaiellaceae bacterium]|nr:ABC transporter permease [Gaiellaceae bacterium]